MFWKLRKSLKEIDFGVVLSIMGATEERRNVSGDWGGFDDFLASVFSVGAGFGCDLLLAVVLNFMKYLLVRFNLEMEIDQLGP
ncbi:hypothetical protein A2U01_0006013 [Trifolium medium]|uniref:Uncharacterized protein n=1 Tax=Trifolium medium TaxID=97028 RepID=A0A392MDP0_9FABA|nr:hypothetical protein [Trifolium medium]